MREARRERFEALSFGHCLLNGGLEISIAERHVDGPIKLVCKESRLENQPQMVVKIGLQTYIRSHGSYDLLNSDLNTDIHRAAGL